jgi:hypothetical protein
VNIDLRGLLRSKCSIGPSKVSATRRNTSSCVDEIVHVVFANAASFVNLSRAHPRKNFAARHLAIPYPSDNRVCRISTLAELQLLSVSDDLGLKVPSIVEG